MEADGSADQPTQAVARHSPRSKHLRLCGARPMGLLTTLAMIGGGVGASLVPAQAFKLQPLHSRRNAAGTKYLRWSDAIVFRSIGLDARIVRVGNHEHLAPRARKVVVRARPA